MLCFCEINGLLTFVSLLYAPVGKKSRWSSRKKDISCKIENCRILCYSILAAPLRPILHGREVRLMDVVSTFLLSVAAGIVAYYICKWLDEQFFVNGKH